MRNRFALAFLAHLLFSTVASAQSPSEDWRTIRTDHFRVHYPAQFEAWAHGVASKLESIREVVISEVGYTPDAVTDVIVCDPVSQANGSAWPFVGAPRMIFWASPPSPAGALGYESDWAELLAIHEWSHVAHLARPSRRPLDRVRWLLAPVALGPIASSPRWVSEGYATLLEGKLTGQGRPYSDYRAAILRIWAQRGRLPSYEKLDSDSSTWMGMSMAYLVGSAYLEWLTERGGEGSLGRLWARMTARESRTFDAAFEGVFGDSPKRLYQRFTAELTYGAMLAEKSSADSLRAGELWMDLSWTTGEPDVSVDGKRLVTIVRAKRKAPRIAVYSTEPDEKAESDYSRRIERMLSRDPQDVAPVRSRPLARKPLAELVLRPGEIVGSPRWIGSTGELLFVLFVPDQDGFLRPDLYRWNPVKGLAPSRLTFGADVRDARPSGDGSYALAVRNRFGMSELVRVDLGDGTTAVLDGPSLDTQFVEPAPHPALPRFAVIVRRDGRWQLEVRELADRAVKGAILFDGIVAHPSWSRDGKSLFATVSRDGFLEISRFDYDAATGTLTERGQITRGSGASLAAVASDDALWFLAIDPDGQDLRRLPLSSVEEALPPVRRLPGMEPALRRVFEGRAPTIESRETSPSVPYGVGRQEISPIFGGAYAPSGNVFEGGVRLGDVLGRVETLVLGSTGSEGGTEGGAVSIVSRKRPMSIGARLFFIEESPSEQKDGELTGSADADRSGLETWLSRSRHWRGGSSQGIAALYASDTKLVGDDALTQLGVGFAARIRHSPSFAGGSLIPLAASVLANAGTTDGESWIRGRTAISLGISFRGRGASIAIDAGATEKDAPALEQFEVGGARGSLLPDAATSNRIDVPALPAGVLRGRSFDSMRFDVKAGPGLPTAFVQRIHADVASGDDEISLAGLEWNVAVPSLPIVRIPALELRAGAARVLDSGLLEDDTSVWLTMRWMP